MQAAAATAATGIETSMLAAAAPFALVAAGIYTAVKAWDAWNDAVGGEGKTAKLDTMLAGAEARLKAIAQFLTGDFKGAIETWQKANKDQVEAEKNIDDIDKQIAENKKKRVAEQAKAERDAQLAAIAEETKAATAKTTASQQATAAKLTDLQRETDASKKSADAVRRNVEDEKKARQSQGTPNKDGSITDNNGIRQFKGESGNGVAPSLANGIKDALLAQSIPLEAIEDALGLKFGRGQPIRGFQSGDAPVIRPNAPDTLNQKDRDIAHSLDKPVSKFDSAVDKFANAIGKDPRTSDQPVDPRDKPFSTAPDNSPTGIPKGEPFPQLPQDQVPGLDKELTPFKGLTDIGDKFTNFGNALDNFASKFANNGQVPSTGNPLGDPSTFDSLKSGIDSLNQAINSLGAQEQQKAAETPQTPDVPAQGLDSLDSSAQNASGGMEKAAGSSDQLAASLQNAAAAADSLASGGGAGFAEGGVIRGPGTGTSDSILARVSAGEFIHTARATSFWGEEFMHSINNLRMPKFAAGGLVNLFSPQMPRFATGGLVDSSSVAPPMAHLGTVDMRTDHGSVRVAVDRGGLSQLRKAAVMRNIGAEKKPSWVR
jgi:hypothetical protein